MAQQQIGRILTVKEVTLDNGRQGIELTGEIFPDYRDKITSDTLDGAVFIALNGGVLVREKQLGRWSDGDGSQKSIGMGNK